MKKLKSECLKKSYLYINKHIYTKISNEENDLYYIFTPRMIEEIYKNEYKFTCKNCYILMVPKKDDCRTYMYDDTNTVIANIYTNDIYELTFSEFVNTFRTFLDSDGKFPNEIPSKLIQDEC